MNKVYRTQRVEGMEIPGIIHNSSYFLVQLSVYEDGVVGCWHRSDLEQFREDLRKGWVVPAVPIGESLSIHHLGSFPIVDAHWCYDTKGFHRYVTDCVKKLNPEMNNLWSATPRELEKWDKHRVSWSATATPCKLTSEVGYNLADGASCNLFYRKSGTLFLTTLTAYKDKTLSIGQGGERFYTLEKINALFEDGTLCTQPQEHEWVMVDGLGELLFGTPDYFVDAREKQKAVAELLKEIADEKTASDLCIEVYYEYLSDPSDWWREELRKAYEAVYIYKQVGEYLYLLLVSVPPVGLGSHISAKLWCKPLQLDEIYWDVFDMKETADGQPFSFHVQGAFTADCLSLEEWKIPISSIDEIDQILIKIFQTTNKYLEQYAKTFKTMKDFKDAISERPNQALNRILCEIYDGNYSAALAKIEECLSKHDTGGYLCGSKSIMDYAKEYCRQRL